MVVATIGAIYFPVAIAYQDMASLIVENTGQRWQATLVNAPGISSFTTGTINPGSRAAEPAGHIGAGVVHGAMMVSMPSLERHRLGNGGAETIDRSLKGDRVVAAISTSPPISFKAGSIMQRTGLLTPSQTDGSLEMAFVKPKSSAEIVEIAQSFHSNAKQFDQLSAEMPVMIAKLVEESAPSLLAYSPEPQLRRSPFAELLRDTMPISIIPKLNKDDHLWAAAALPNSVFSESEQRCLTAGIYFEARGEPARGQAAVAQVILNRVRNPTYPNSICGVVYQNKNWRNRCQFSFACDRVRDRVKSPRLWKMAETIADQATAGRIWLADVGSSTHYHATYVRPKWSRAMKQVSKIGRHIFYRTYNGGWS